MRLFFAIVMVALAGWQAPNMPVGRVVVDGSGVPTRQTIAPADLQVLGAFQLPGSMQYNVSIATRTVNGVDHILTWGGGVVREWVVPGLKTPPSNAGENYYNQVSMLYAVWPSPLGAKQVNCAGEPWAGSTGIFWQEARQRLYVSYGADYPQGSAAYSACRQKGDPFFGYGLLSSLSGTVGTSTPIGTWKTTTLRYKGLYYGMYAIPDAWQAALHGDVALAGGGYGSLICNPDLDGSAGPAAAAFDSSVLPIAQGSGVSVTPLYGHFHGYCDSKVVRAAVPVLSVPRDNHFEGPAYNGVFSSFDTPNAQIMVDDGVKAGLLSFEWYFAGYGQYIGSYLNREGADHWLRIYNLSDLAKVAAGSRAASSLVSVSHTRWIVPDFNYAARPLVLGPSYRITGIAATAGRMTATVTCPSCGGGVIRLGAPLHQWGADQAEYNGGFLTVGPLVDANTYLIQKQDHTAFSGKAWSSSAGAFVRDMTSSGPTDVWSGLEQIRWAVAYNQTSRKIYLNEQVPFDPNVPSTWRNVIYVIQVL